MKEIKKPDVKAPRFRPEVHSVLTKEFFDNFRNKYPKYKNFDNAQLKSIIKLFNKTVYQTVINTRDGIQLPESIGWLFIGTCQQSKKKNIDFAKSHNYGVIVSNNNWATDGKLAKIFYTNYAPKIKIKNKEYWKFVACREFKRAVAKAYPENWNMYVVVDPNAKIRTTYQKFLKKEYAIKKEKEALKTYNEFNL
jgi:hypothetical protein